MFSNIVSRVSSHFFDTPHRIWSNRALLTGVQRGSEETVQTYEPHFQTPFVDRRATFSIHQRLSPFPHPPGSPKPMRLTHGSRQPCLVPMPEPHFWTANRHTSHVFFLTPSSAESFGPLTTSNCRGVINPMPMSEPCFCRRSVLIPEPLFCGAYRHMDHLSQSNGPCFWRHH